MCGTQEVTIYRDVIPVARCLLKVAGELRLITYGELMFLYRKDRRSIGYYAGTIGDACIELGWPPLNSLIINKYHGEASHGFDSYAEHYKMTWGDCIQACYKKFKNFEPRNDKKFVQQLDAELEGRITG